MANDDNGRIVSFLSETGGKSPQSLYVLVILFLGLIVGTVHVIQFGGFDQVSFDDTEYLKVALMSTVIYTMIELPRLRGISEIRRLVISFVAVGNAILFSEISSPGTAGSTAIWVLILVFIGSIFAVSERANDPTDPLSSGRTGSIFADVSGRVLPYLGGFSLLYIFFQ